MNFLDDSRFPKLPEGYRWYRGRTSAGAYLMIQKRGLFGFWLKVEGHYVLGDEPYAVRECYKDFCNNRQYGGRLGPVVQ